MMNHLGRFDVSISYHNRKEINEIAFNPDAIKRGPSSSLPQKLERTLRSKKALSCVSCERAVRI